MRAKVTIVHHLKIEPNETTEEFIRRVTEKFGAPPTRIELVASSREIRETLQEHTKVAKKAL